MEIGQVNRLFIFVRKSDGRKYCTSEDLVFLSGEVVLVFQPFAYEGTGFIEVPSHVELKLIIIKYAVLFIIIFDFIKSKKW